MMRAFLMMTGLVVAIFGAVASARQAPLADVDLGDSKGAAFDVAAPGTASAADFDFLVGTWDFRFQQLSGQGKYSAVTPGVWTGQKTHDGHIVEDVWRLGTTTNPTITYRIFNPSRHLWEIQGTKPERGGWDDGIGWTEGNTRMLVQHYNSSGMLARIKYFDLTPQHFRWRADGSTDQGKTWTPDIWKMDATRRSTAPAALLPAAPR